MTDVAKIARAAATGCALLDPNSNQDDRAAYLDAMGQLDGDNDAVLMLIGMKLLQGSPYQMTSSDPERITQAMTLAMHIGGSWVEKGKGTDASPRVIALLPPARNESSSGL